MMFVGMQLVANDRTKVSLDGGETVRKTTLRGNGQKANRSKFRVKESPKQSKSDEQLLFLFLTQSSRPIRIKLLRITNECKQV